MRPVHWKAVQGLGLAILISVLAISLLIFLLPFPFADLGDDRPVIQSYAPVTLEESSLVTFLKQIPLIYRYKRVKIEENELYIDLLWPLDTLDGAYREAAYADALRLIEASFTDTTNIEVIYLRFIGLKGDAPTLILAVSCERTPGLIRILSREEGAPKEAKWILERYARLVYGTGWRN